MSKKKNTIVGTITQVNKEISTYLDIDEEIVEAVNKFFWKSGVKDSIREGVHTNIRIRGFGTITTSRYKLKKAINKSIRQVRYLSRPNTEFKQKDKDKLLKEEYDKLSKLLKRRNILATAYYKTDNNIK